MAIIDVDKVLGPSDLDYDFALMEFNSARRHMIIGELKHSPCWGCPNCISGKVCSCTLPNIGKVTC